MGNINGRPRCDSSKTQVPPHSASSDELLAEPLPSLEMSTSVKSSWGDLGASILP
jgi:hypothetical protein